MPYQSICKPKLSITNQSLEINYMQCSLDSLDSIGDTTEVKQNMVDFRHGPTSLMVTFRLMAHPAQEQNRSFFVETKSQRLLSSSDKGISVYSPLTKSCHLNCLILLSHCKPLKTSHNMAIGCQSQ